MLHTIHYYEAYAIKIDYEEIKQESWKKDVAGITCDLVRVVSSSKHVNASPHTQSRSPENALALEWKL